MVEFRQTSVRFAVNAGEVTPVRYGYAEVVEVAVIGVDKKRICHFLSFLVIARVRDRSTHFELETRNRIIYKPKPMVNEIRILKGG